jgi:hypothetical protein
LANYAPLTLISFIERAAAVFPKRIAWIHSDMRATAAAGSGRARRNANVMVPWAGPLPGIQALANGGGLARLAAHLREGEGGMLASGSFIAGVGLLLATLLALLFRHPNAPRWTRPEIVAMLIAVPVSGIICFGFGYVAYGLSELVRGAGDPRELLVLAGVVIALVVVWMGLGIRRRLRAYALVTAGTAPNVHQLNEVGLATDEAPPPSTPETAPASSPKGGVRLRFLMTGGVAWDATPPAPAHGGPHVLTYGGLLLSASVLALAALLQGPAREERAR